MRKRIRKRFLLIMWFCAHRGRKFHFVYILIWLVPTNERSTDTTDVGVTYARSSENASKVCGSRRSRCRRATWCDRGQRGARTMRTAAAAALEDFRDREQRRTRRRAGSIRPRVRVPRYCASRKDGSLMSVRNDRTSFPARQWSGVDGQFELLVFK